MASGRGKKGSAKRRNGSEHYGIPAGGRSSRERRAATWIAQHSATTKNYTNAADSSTIASYSTRITHIPVLRRKAFGTPYTHLESLKSLGANIWKNPRFEIIHEALGRYAVRRFGYDDTMQRIQSILPGYDTVVHIDARSVIPERGRSGLFYVSVVPDEASEEFLFMEKLQAAKALESSMLPERRSIRIAGNLSENQAEFVSSALMETVDMNNMLQFGAPMPVIIDQSRRK